MWTGMVQSAMILGGILAFYGMDVGLMAHYDKQRRSRGSGRSWDYTLMAMTAMMILVLQPIVAPGLGLHLTASWGRWIQVAGLVLMAGALLLHGWARMHLKHFYAERVELQESHRLVDSGPYAYVRHPIFTSFFLFAVGLLLVNPALPTLVVAGYVFWDFSRAARQEEALLSQNLAGYAEYMARTSRFLPRLRISKRE